MGKDVVMLEVTVLEEFEWDDEIRIPYTRMELPNDVAVDFAEQGRIALLDPNDGKAVGKAVETTEGAATSEITEEVETPAEEPPVAEAAEEPKETAPIIEDPVEEAVEEAEEAAEEEIEEVESGKPFSVMVTKEEFFGAENRVAMFSKLGFDTSQSITRENVEDNVIIKGVKR